MWLSWFEYVWEWVCYVVNEVLVVLVSYGWVFIVYFVVGIGVEYCLGLLWVDEGVDLLDVRLWCKLFGLVFEISVENSIYGFGYNSFVVEFDGCVFNVYYVCSYCDIVGDLFKDSGCVMCV